MKFGKNIMSRIGKQPIKIPEKVEVKIDGQFIIVKGARGELRQELLGGIKAEIQNNEIAFSPISLEKLSGLNRKKVLANWGTIRMLIFNMIKGVTEGFEKKLELQGIGYRAALEGKKMILGLGFSHPVEIQVPEGIEFKIEKNIITVSGINKQLVGQTAAEIRAKKKPEPYKGKGIRYLGEVVRRKAGKKAVATTK